MSEPAALAVVVVTHDSAAWLAECMASWERSAAASRILKQRGWKLVIADSGSRDGTVDAARKLGATVVECGDVGYGAAANSGVAAAGTTWVMVCNPDLVFPVEFAQGLIDPVLDGPPGGPAWRNGSCIAPRLMNADGSVQASVGKFFTLGGVVRDQFRPRELRKYVKQQPTAAKLVDWAMGACLLLKREAFEAVGGFDEKFFLYVEEVDLQRRMWQGGHGTWFVPEVTVIHGNPNAARTPRANVQKWAARGMLRYFAKHGSAADLCGFKALALLSGRLRLGEVMRGRKGILERGTR